MARPAKPGERYRLPSEAEWEYAARAGRRRDSPWGDAPEDGCESANTYDVTADAALSPRLAAFGLPRRLTPTWRRSASCSANAFNLHDMIGNVREWVQDCATGSYVGRPRDARAWEWLGGCGDASSAAGSWLSPPDESRSACAHSARVARASLR